MGCGIDISDLLRPRRPVQADPTPPAPPKQEIHYHYEGDRSVKISDSVVSRSNLTDEGPAASETGRDSQASAKHREPPASAPAPDRVLRVCPYCGETLELPAPPRFCPYCTARLTVD